MHLFFLPHREYIYQINESLNHKCHIRSNLMNMVAVMSTEIGLHKSTSSLKAHVVTCRQLCLYAITMSAQDQYKPFVSHKLIRSRYGDIRQEEGTASCHVIEGRKLILVPLLLILYYLGPFIFIYTNINLLLSILLLFGPFLNVHYRCR